MHLDVLLDLLWGNLRVLYLWSRHAIVICHILVLHASNVHTCGQNWVQMGSLVVLHALNILRLVLAELNCLLLGLLTSVSIRYVSVPPDVVVCGEVVGLD